MKNNKQPVEMLKVEDFNATKWLNLNNRECNSRKRYLRDIKTSTSIWLKQSGIFPDFDGWADGYAAFTYAWRDKEMIANYIRNQHEHHKKESFEDELKRLLKGNEIDVNERFFP